MTKSTSGFGSKNCCKKTTTGMKNNLSVNEVVHICICIHVHIQQYPPFPMKLCKNVLLLFHHITEMSIELTALAVSCGSGDDTSCMSNVYGSVFLS